MKNNRIILRLNIAIDRINVQLNANRSLDDKKKLN